MRDFYSTEGGLAVVPRDGKFIASVERAGAISRADCEALRDWLTARLEETKPKPQPGEVWELADGEGGFLFVGSKNRGRWHSVERATWLGLSATPICRIGKIVYDE